MPLQNNPMEKNPVQPYQNSDSGKKDQIEAMFDNIAPRYDFLNHFLSMGVDRGWRKKAIRQLKSSRPKHILDIATGTGGLAIESAKLKPTRIVGIDLSEKMLDIGKEKVRLKKLDQLISLQKGDSENLDFADGTFDAATAAFGVRNFENLEKGLKEIYRVLRPGGKIVILEFSKPNNRITQGIYYFYFFRILPALGRMVSKDSSAYTYLPESVDVFPSGEEFLSLLENAGFGSLTCRELSMGIASIYSGIKEDHNNNMES